MKEYYLKYNNHNICVYENGKGEIPIVLLHGAGLDSAILSWKEVINLLPNKVKALIPVDSWGLSSKMPFHKLYYWYIHTSSTRKSFQYFAKYKWLIKASVHYSLIGDKSKISKELIETLYHTCQNSYVAKSMEDYQRSSITKYNNIPDFTKELSNIYLPVLFINGEKDSLVKVKDITKASKLIPKSSIHIMKKCKHWSQKERPEEYVKIVNKFVDELIITINN